MKLNEKLIKSFELSRIHAAESSNFSEQRNFTFSAIFIAVFQPGQHYFTHPLWSDGEIDSEITAFDNRKVQDKQQVRDQIEETFHEHTESSLT